MENIDAKLLRFQGFDKLPSARRTKPTSNRSHPCTK
jgi:hypothetical protein